MDKLIADCLDSRLGARVGNVIVSTLSYCDDLVLLSPSLTEMCELLTICDRFTAEWEVEFNGAKSISCEFCPIKFGGIDFFTSGSVKPLVDSFTHLGFPFSSLENVQSFYEEKMRKVEKSFFSLYGLGCKRGHLSAYTIAFMYKLSVDHSMRL